MPSLRLLADDLTGALDTAAEFVGLCGPLPVGWAGALPPILPSNLAIDCGTRERTRNEAVEIVGELAPLLQDASIAYKKIDSLMRGPWAAELAACLGRGAWRHCILAPAFPYQGRRTRAGRQFARTPDSSWHAASGDLAAELRAEGLVALRASPQDALANGVSIFDAETDEDLDGVVASARNAAGRLLWCGSGGLARALARGHELEARSRLKPPVLGLFGSDQPASLAQLAACAVHWLRFSTDEDIRAVERRLAETGVALVSLALPPGTSRGAAAARIGERLGGLAARLAPPGTLIVAGGETLKALCGSLGTQSLLVTGEIEQGVPRSVMRGGLWDGVEIVSKSGAFGPPTLWRDLLAANGLMRERSEA